MCISSKGCIITPAMLRRGRNLDSAVQALGVYRARIGPRPVDRLTWALRLAQRPLSAITPADWENIRHEIAAALEASGHRGESVQSDRLPDVEEARKIHADLANFFGRLLLGKEFKPDRSV